MAPPLATSPAVKPVGRGVVVIETILLLFEGHKLRFELVHIAV